MTLVRTLEAGAEPVFTAQGPAAFISVVPTMLRSMIERGADLAAWRAILVGGGPIPTDLREMTASRGGNLVTTYGQTETCGGVVYDGVPLDGAGIEIRDAEIYVSGPTLMTGYLGDPEATARKLDGGWVATGDEGSFTDGRLTVIGRLDEVIITGGEKVSPIEIESLIKRYPGVTDVAVVGLDDARWGQEVVAAVVAEPADFKGLHDWLRERLEPFKIPKSFVEVEAIPRTDLGKVRRADLRNEILGMISP